MNIIECKTDEDILSTHSVMLQLRPALHDATVYLALVKQLQLQEKFRLVGLFEENKCIAVVGFRIQSNLFRAGKPELYVNDLIVDNASRRKGYGKMLMAWLRKEVHNITDSAGLVLDSGNQRLDTHAFYREQGFDQTALHFYRSKTPEPFLKIEEEKQNDSNISRPPSPSMLKK